MVIGSAATPRAFRRQMRQFPTSPFLLPSTRLQRESFVIVVSSARVAVSLPDPSHFLLELSDADNVGVCNVSRLAPPRPACLLFRFSGDSEHPGC